jgi:hypothetical protein
MTHQKRLRPYRVSNLYRQDPPTAALEAAAVERREQLVRDLGGPDAVWTAQKLLVDIAVAHAIKLQRVEAYIATMSSLVDKRHRTTWRVVQDAAKLASRLESVLIALGIERKAQPLNLIGQIQAMHAADDAAVSRPERQRATQPDEVVP